jgi:hypothetical protein
MAKRENKTIKIKLTNHFPSQGAPLSLAGLLLTATALLFLFFLVLSGVTNSTPLNKTHFLQADTSGITGARDVTRWTYFYMCGEENANCGRARPAPPFGKAWDANAQNVPQELMGCVKTHFLL